MAEFAALRPKTCSYLTSNNYENKKTSSTKKQDIKRKINFEDYNHCLQATQLKNKMNHLEKIDLMQIVLEKSIKDL